MKLKITAKLTLTSILLVLFSVSSFMTVGYFVNHAYVEKAAGEELIGCANITTGMIDTDVLERYMQGEDALYAGLLNKVNYTVDHKPIFLNAYIVSLEGILVVPDSRLQAQGFSAGDRFYLDDAALNTMLHGNHPSYSGIYEYGGMERMTGYAPIYRDHDPSQPILALMAVDFSESVIAGRTADMLAYTIKLGGVFPILAGVVSYVFARRLTRPLHEITDQMNRLAEGDLTLPLLKVTRSDELGILKIACNRMYDTLQHDIRTLTDLAKVLHENSQVIAVMTDQLATASDTQNTSLRSADGMIREMSRAVQSVAENTEQAVSTFDYAVEAKNNGAKVVHSMMAQMGTITTRMNELSSKSQRIGEIIEVIDKIADQTNLLSLNAAIEAARAGEAGKGFAVVADEVRKLAEHSGRATREISGLIDTIRHDTQAAVEAVASGNAHTTNAGNAFDTIADQIAQASGRMTEIAAASQQQAAQSVEVLASVEQMARLTDQSEQAVQASVEKVREIEQLAASLENISSKFRMTRG